MLETTLQLGEAVEHRGVVLAPLFPRRSPAAEYVTLDDALPLGLRIDEVSESGSVPQLAVANPTDANVLLYDGEELVGAKQNRILNVTVLVAAKSTTPIPVSCVEEGAGAGARRTSPPRPMRRTRSCAGGRHSRSRPSRSHSGSPRARSGTRCGRSRPGSASTRRRARSRTCSARGARAARARAGLPAPARSAAPCSRSAKTSASTSSRGRLPSRASTRSCARGTSSTGSSGSAEAGAARAPGAVCRVGRGGDAGSPSVRRARQGRPPGGRRCRRLGPGARR